MSTITAPTNNMAQVSGVHVAAKISDYSPLSLSLSPLQCMGYGVQGGGPTILPDSEEFATQPLRRAQEVNSSRTITWSATT